MFLQPCSFDSIDPSKKSNPNGFLVSITAFNRDAVNGVVVGRGDDVFVAEYGVDPLTAKDAMSSKTNATDPGDLDFRPVAKLYSL